MSNKLSENDIDQKIYNIFGNKYVRILTLESNLLLMKCNICDSENKQRKHHVLSGHGCKICKIKIIKNKLKLNEKQIDNLLYSKFGKSFIVEKINPYDSIKTTIWNFKCKTCGTNKNNKISNVLYSHNNKCSICLKNKIFDEKLKKFNIIRCENVISSRQKILLKCGACEFYWKKTPNNFDRNFHIFNCPNCLSITRSEKMKKFWEDFYTSGRNANNSIFSGIKSHKKGYVLNYVFQSSYEENFLKFCLKTQLNFKWQYIKIPYLYKNNNHVYIVDAFLYDKNTLVEIKASNILEGFKNSKYGDYEQLLCKIEAAKKYALENNMVYEIWTEKTHPWLKSGII